ncbi:DUF6470 family protein [Halalkalibacter urbisdiaboli]|uniref:DUF6470 family protein n=1 Tax=Halalkalibacter urbisdiaboli TaxID=1960589 RepID=UPI000B43E47F|nr:DUF6470 family protein [Halalkalibacter urbisdiaboli]
MRLPTIDIQKNDAYIGLRSQQPPMKVKQHHANLQINQEHAALIEISTTASKLSIDQTEAFADANLKTPLRLANDYWNKTEGVVAKYVAKTAQQGKQMMQIENGFGAFPRIAKQNSEKPEKQLTLVQMPRSAFKINFDYQPSEVNFRVPNKKPEIRVTPHEPDISIPKWQTDVYVRQKEQISFQAVGGILNKGL